jgi:hypothetical protein
MMRIRHAFLRKSSKIWAVAGDVSGRIERIVLRNRMKNVMNHGRRSRARISCGRFART